MARAEIRVVASVDLDQVATELDQLLKASSEVVSFIDTSRPGGQHLRDELVRATRALDAVVGKAVVGTVPASTEPASEGA